MFKIENTAREYDIFSKNKHFFSHLSLGNLSKLQSVCLITFAEISNIEANRFPMLFSFEKYYQLNNIS